jgi:hypothetical protein
MGFRRPRKCGCLVYAGPEDAGPEEMGAELCPSSNLEFENIINKHSCFHAAHLGSLSRFRGFHWSISIVEAAAGPQTSHCWVEIVRNRR